jgi:RNA polymerase sigma-70 factor (ECF subfamily)
LAERDVIEHAKRGDGPAFEQLVRPYLDLAFRTAFVITRDAADAEDATQAALIKAFAHLDRFRGGEPFRPWLLQIVANEAKNVVRSRTRRRSDPFADSFEPGTTDADDPLHQLESLERSSWLVTHINQLGENDRIVIFCRYALDLTEDDMASVLGCARGTVKSRLHRALARLRARIEADQDREEVPS